MNKDRRKRIAEIHAKMTELRDMLEEILEEEQEAFDNMPESLQSSERGENMETVIYNLEEALETFASACEEVEEIES